MCWAIPCPGRYSLIVLFFFFLKRLKEMLFRFVFQKRGDTDNGLNEDKLKLLTFDLEHQCL